MINKQASKLLTEIMGLDGVLLYSHQQYEGIGMILQIESIAVRHFTYGIVKIGLSLSTLSTALLLSIPLVEMRRSKSLRPDAILNKVLELIPILPTVASIAD